MRLLRKGWTIMCLLMLANVLFAQRVTVNYILGATEREVGRYAMPPDFYSVQMPFSFATDSFTTEDKVMFEEYPVYQVDLVYSDFRSSATFSQEDLNRRRLEALRKSMPQLFQQTAIDWRLIRQMEGATRQEAQGLYHGFAFHFRVPRILGRDGKMVELDAKAEKDLIHSALLDTLPPDYQPFISCEHIPVLDTFIRENISYKRIDLAGPHLYSAVRRKRYEKGMQFKKRSIFIRRSLACNFTSDTIITLDTLVGIAGVVIPIHLDSAFYATDRVTRYSYWSDSVVIKTFKEHPKWKDILVVEDVTGSMTPYIGQTLLWRRISKEYDRIKHWAFFNDGDAFPDGPIGRSDGVHFIKSAKEKLVEDMVKSAMSKGYGGAGPENDIEAMGKGLKRSGFRPKAIVLIADNYSPVRDLKLFRNLRANKIPIYVIVCGSRGHINVEYLEIARRTKGKVFTMEGELEDLLTAKEGDKLRIGSQKYIVRGGKLVLRR